jgi:hypothetical protein
VKKRLLIAISLFFAFSLTLPVFAADDGDLALIGGKVYPSPTAAPVENAEVVVRSGKIESVGKQGKVQGKPLAKVIDCSGKVIVASFWNSHVHFEAGWQDAANQPAAELETRIQEESGTEILQKLRLKQSLNFWISRLLSKCLERFSVRVTRSAQGRETTQESRNPLRLPSLDRMCNVAQFNPQESAHFSQVLNRPTRRSRAESAISGIHIRASSDQRLHDRSMPSERGVVKDRSSQLIPFVNEFRVAFENAYNICKVATLYGLNQLFQMSHRIAPSSGIDKGDCFP